MDFFKLPQRARVQKVVPKNAFDSFTNSKQKKLFADKISRISWTHKLSEETVNLPAKDIKEIQIFKIELKVREEIKSLLDIIDKAIPYNIIFVVEFGESSYVSASVKHPHAINENISVVDWSFKSDWIKTSENVYQLNLRKNLDAVFKNIYVQILGKSEISSKPLSTIVKSQQEIQTINNEIERLKSQISKCKQFNEKVELNLKLKGKEKQLEQYWKTR